MANLTDIIERYLKQLLAKSQTGSVDIGRNQLAETFACAPSQINYVLGTRFLLEHGYVVETRRGGGGYVRISMLELDPAKDWQLLIDSVGESISQQKGEAIVEWLLRDELISGREAALMLATLSGATAGIKSAWADTIRANILRSLIIVLYRM